MAASDGRSSGVSENYQRRLGSVGDRWWILAVRNILWMYKASLLISKVNEAGTSKLTEHEKREKGKKEEEVSQLSSLQKKKNWHALLWKDWDGV